MSIGDHLFSGTKKSHCLWQWLFLCVLLAGLTLGELEGFPCAGEAVLLAFLFSGIPCEVAFGFEGAAVGFVDLNWEAFLDMMDFDEDSIIYDCMKRRGFN